MTISTIIPVLNDAAALRHCLAALSKCSGAESNQIIVADGGRSAEIESISREFHVTHVSCEPGRATQMNWAVPLAQGEWLWFLHADCIPHRESLKAISELTHDACWGCFKHRIDAPGAAFRLIECADNLRAKLCGLPYGDQGIFVRAKSFRALGGYAAVPLLEDVILAQSLRTLCAPRVLSPLLLSSPRRWLQRGILRTTFTNLRIMAAYLSGWKSPHELAADYK